MSSQNASSFRPYSISTLYKTYANYLKEAGLSLCISYTACLCRVLYQPSRFMLFQQRQMILGFGHNQYGRNQIIAPVRYVYNEYGDWVSLQKYKEEKKAKEMRMSEIRQRFSLQTKIKLQSLPPLYQNPHSPSSKDSRQPQQLNTNLITHIKPVIYSDSSPSSSHKRSRLSKSRMLIYPITSSQHKPHKIIEDKMLNKQVNSLKHGTHQSADQKTPILKELAYQPWKEGLAQSRRRKARLDGNRKDKLMYMLYNEQRFY